MNLLSNAVKFTQDGTITVSAWLKAPRIKHHRSISSTETPISDNPLDRMGMLYVQVKDSGCGIPLTEIPKLFKDFSTLQSNQHLNPNGVGLGLSICKKITNLLNGDIKVDSVIGKGSTFTFYVAIEPNTDTAKKSNSHVSGNHDTSESASIIPSMLPNLPDEFSLITGRMHAVYKQFQTQDSNLMLASAKDAQPILGPVPKSCVSLNRMLVVDDQVFNIEFLRCQIELIPSMRGRCDYSDCGQTAIDFVKENLKV